MQRNKDLHDAINQARSRIRQTLNSKFVDPETWLSELSDVSAALRTSWAEMNRNQVEALRLRSDICFRMLAKTLPDLKALDAQIEQAPKAKYRIEGIKGDES